ncbi:MAG: ATP-binding protein [bacterium]|nr:ATP-binding protein [bacterium]
MKNLPVGIQTFSKLIEGDYLYIDKTRDIYNLFAKGGQYYFLSRPRRFGKSLLISTMAELFSGNKELFKGLWIYDKIQWIKYPVIHIDLTKVNSDTPERLQKSLGRLMDDIAESHGISLDPNRYYDEKFAQLISKLSKKGTVVILIDEYDKPIIRYVETDEIETAKQIRDVLKSFYGVIKASDEFLHFVFITGVSKFSKVSVFSDLNNLTDITLREKFSTIAGYTEAEMKHYFPPYIEKMAEKRGMPQEYLTQTIRKWYNGYSWDGTNFVYNPFSILNLFNDDGFGNFWFSTGTPTFLIQLIKSQKMDIMAFESLIMDEFAFDNNDIDTMEISALLFQTGYLTIKKVILKNVKKKYELSYPNYEVRNAFLTYLLGEFTQKKPAFNTQLIERIGNAVEADNMEGFVQELKTLFAAIPYNIFIGEREAYYHTVIYLVLRLNGIDARPEDPTNTGRIDAVVETGKNIYIMEFKMGSEQDALNQIKDMKYYEKYQGKGKEIVLMGIGFDPEKRNIGNYIFESLAP